MIITSCRETLFSTLSKSQTLQALLKISTREARYLEVQTLLASSINSRSRGTPQASLNTTTYLSHLIEPCRQVGLRIDVAAQFEASNVLWDQGYMSASIKMLREVVYGADFRSQSIHVGKSELLAKLVSRFA
jgi:serine-protein kinase ATM